MLLIRVIGGTTFVVVPGCLDKRSYRGMGSYFDAVSLPCIYIYILLVSLHMNKIYDVHVLQALYSLTLECHLVAFSCSTSRFYP
jgi:hypothetical protein